MTKNPETSPSSGKHSNFGCDTTLDTVKNRDASKGTGSRVVEIEPGR